MEFKDFVQQNEMKKEYRFTVKVACDMLNPEMLKLVESNLSIYNVISVGKVFSSPLLENPLDFPNIRNTSVHAFDVALKYPITSDAIEHLVSCAMGIKRGLVVVYNEHDPRKTYTKDILDQKDAKKEDYVTKLGNEDPPAEPHKLYGDEYNVPFLDYLKSNRPTPVTITNSALSPEQKIDHSDLKNEKMPEPNGTTPFTNIKRPVFSR